MAAADDLVTELATLAEELGLGDRVDHLVSEAGDTVARVSMLTVARSGVGSGQVADAPDTGADYLPPPYNPNQLAKLPERSSILPQCVAALVAGIEGHGYSLDSVPGALMPKPDAARKEEMLEEQQRIRRWFDHAAGDLSWQDSREARRTDEETIGWGAWEFLEDDDGELVGLETIKARTLRLMPREKDPITVKRYRMSTDGSEWEETEVERRVRLYLQLGSNGERAYFKEPGDPRAIDRATGKVLSENQAAPAAGLARELLFMGRYNPAGDYPVPRWIGATGAIGGSFAAEQRNLSWFENPIPIMMLLVSGGQLPREAHEYLAQKLEEARKNDKHPSIVIVEALKRGGGSPSLGDLMSPGANTTPSLDTVKLNDLSPHDGQFQRFDLNSRGKVRSSCGIPPLFTAETEEYTRATAQAALQVAEQGTFAPARRRLDTAINRHIMPRIGARWFVYRGNGPKITSMEDVGTAAEALAKLGAGTPNVGADLVGRALGVEVPQFDQSWADLPFALVQTLANQGLLDVMQEERLERAVTRVVERVLAKAAAGWEPGAGGGDGG